MKKLNKTDERNAFRVPEGYFEGFEQRLAQRIHGRNEGLTPSKKSTLFRPWISMAAGFALIALLYTLVPEQFRQNKEQTADANILLHELQQSELLTEYELVNWLTEMSPEDFEVYPDSLLFQNLNEEDLIYLSYID